MHTLTRESQEQMVTFSLILPFWEDSSMAWTPIPHCGQLNIEISILLTRVSTPASKLDLVGKKVKVILADGCMFIVNS